MIDTLLSTEQDKTGAEINIYATAQIGMSPLCSIFMQKYGELIATGHAWPRMQATNKTKAIHVKVGDDIAGFITYDLQPEWGTTYIYFSWVSEKYRQRGLYKQMFAQLEKIARMSRCYKIHSDAHVDNISIIEAHRSVGMSTVFYKNEKNLAP